MEWNQCRASTFSSVVMVYNPGIFVYIFHGVTVDYISIILCILVKSIIYDTFCSDSGIMPDFTNIEQLQLV